MRILVADDDAISRLIVETALRSAGHECTTVADGARALELFQADRFDVVISDWMMPGLAGPDLCRAIRAQPRGRSIYFVMVTRKGDPEQVFEGMSAGADDYLVKPFDPDELVNRLVAAERVTSLHLQLNEQRSELEGVNLELTAMTRHDPLTALGNRRALQQDLEQLEARVARYGHRYCMALLDVDRFKSYNDTYGHPAGDQVLKAVADQLTDHVRAGDAVYRYGGEEFLCIFPEQSLAAGIAAVERMRVGLRRLSIAHTSSPQGIVTMSAGVAMLDAGNARSASAVLAEADAALYLAKQQGRDQVQSVKAATHPDGPDIDHVIPDRSAQGIDEASPIYALVDVFGVVEHVSDRTVGLLALQHETLVGQRALDRVDPADLDRVAANWSHVLATSGATERCVMRVLDGAARWRDLDLEITNLLDNPAVGAIAVTGFDVTSGSLSQIARRLEGRLLKHLPTAVVVIDDEGSVVYWNNRAADTYGYRPAEAIGRPIVELEILPADIAVTMRMIESANETGRWEGDYEARRADGSVVPIHAVIERLVDDEIGFRGFVGSSTDVSERQAQEAAHAYELLHDSMTGLPNRILFVDHLTRALERSSATALHTAVLCIGLDDFAAVNEGLGVHAGDSVLCAIGDLVPTALSAGDVVARGSGDEFIVCCEGVSDLASALRIAASIATAIGAPFGTTSESMQLTASIGVALSGPRSHSDGLLRNAASAMQAAKTAGKARVEVFDDAMHDELRAQRDRALALEAALDAGEIHAWFQPEIDLKTGTLVAFEALARWIRPDGVVMPASFIGLAEETGLIGTLGHAVLVDACNALAGWLDAAPERPVRVAVNISPFQLADPAFPDMVRSVIEAARVPAGRVCLELTESALADPSAALVALRALKVVGVELAIDDFGTGYSSLGRLQRFPVDYLKIDRSFVAGMAVRREDGALVHAVVQLARTLGLRTVAEGVEQDFQLEQLASLGCDIGQGYLWDQAVPADEALRMVRSTEVFRHAPQAAPDPEVMSSPSAVPDDANQDVSDVSVAILAHELAAPITVLAAYGELLATTDDPDLREEAVAAIDRATKQARAALGLACDVAALAAGTLTLNPTTVELRALVDASVELAGLASHPTLSVEVPDVTIDGDVDRLVGVLSNLLLNAIGHAPLGTIVQVRAHIEDRHVTVHVVDDGPGVPSGQAGLIFRRFGRANRDTKGTGLGLYLARAVVRAHGGDLTYQPVPTGGADFAMELPLPEPQHVSWHGAKVYADDAEIVASVADHLAPALIDGGTALVVAAPERAADVRDDLRRRGLAVDDGSFVALDAAATLDALLVDGVPDAALFQRFVGDVVRRLSSSGHTVTIYGEMVGLLWQRGDLAAAMHLEDIWNELAVGTPFRLLCGYPGAMALGPEDVQSRGGCHQIVIGAVR